MILQWPNAMTGLYWSVEASLVRQVEEGRVYLPRCKNSSSYKAREGEDNRHEPVSITWGDGLATCDAARVSL